jgi:hypothetical protein
MTTIRSFLGRGPSAPSVEEHHDQRDRDDERDNARERSDHRDRDDARSPDRERDPRRRGADPRNVFTRSLNLPRGRDARSSMTPATANTRCVGPNAGRWPQSAPSGSCPRVTSGTETTGREIFATATSGISENRASSRPPASLAAVTTRWS